MPQLVDQRELAVQIVVMIQENVRMRPRAAGRVGAAALAFVFVDIDPALAKRAV